MGLVVLLQAGEQEDEDLYALYKYAPCCQAAAPSLSIARYKVIC